MLGRENTESLGYALVDDDRMSRSHATIRLSGSGGSCEISLRDNNSKNGTFVNGERVRTTALVDGDVLRVGDTLFLLRVAPAKLLDSDIPLIVGRSPASCALRHRIAEAAVGRLPVLLLGEPGVGKELAARALHERSRRAGSFLATNCAGLSDSLADSLLFGHERGSFTGASESREGLFKAANHGTLFLDEVAELPIGVQAKLLRALQESEIQPLGRLRPMPIDVRIIAATNKNLAHAITANQFRDDLYSRLKGVELRLPPLRDRREDILPILQHLLGGLPRLTPRLVEAMVLHDWPHNVRELKHLAEALRPAHEAGRELDLPAVAERFRSYTRIPMSEQFATDKAPGNAGPHASALDTGGMPTVAGQPRLTKETLERLGQETNWNISALSRRMGLSRRQVGRWLEKFGLGSRGASRPRNPLGNTPGEDS